MNYKLNIYDCSDSNTYAVTISDLHTYIIWYIILTPYRLEGKFAIFASS